MELGHAGARCGRRCKALGEQSIDSASTDLLLATAPLSRAPPWKECRHVRRGVLLLGEASVA
eukprot:2140258-Pyramimonas_sp.AAC.1